MELHAVFDSQPHQNGMTDLLPEAPAVHAWQHQFSSDAEPQNKRQIKKNWLITLMIEVVLQKEEKKITTGKSAYSVIVCYLGVPGVSLLNFIKTVNYARRR